MNHPTFSIVRSLLSLLIVGIIAVVAASEARAQCGVTLVTINNVFLLRPASPPLIGTLVLDFGGSPSFTQTFAASADGSTTIAYPTGLGVPTNVTLNINGHTIIASGTAIVPDPDLPPCLCLEVTLTTDTAGCIFVVINLVCC